MIEELRKRLEEIAGLAVAIIGLGGGWYAGLAPPVERGIGFGVATTVAILTVLFFGVLVIRRRSAARTMRIAYIAGVWLAVAFVGYFWAYGALVMTDPLSIDAPLIVKGVCLTPDAQQLCGRLLPTDCIKSFGALEMVYPAQCRVIAELLLLVGYCSIAASLSLLVMALLHLQRREQREASGPPP